MGIVLAEISSEYKETIMSSEKPKLYATKRTLDSLGRVVVPIEMRRYLDIEVDGLVDITLVNKSVVLTKAVDKNLSICLLCHKQKKLLTNATGLEICKDCAELVAALV